MRVVHLPVYAENPYQPQLMDALRAQGIEVIDGGGGGNFFRTALFRWKPDILHFHWLHPYLLRPSLLDSIVRATRFLCEIKALRLAGSRVVWTVHNLANHNQHQAGLERRFTTGFAQIADGVIVHSQVALPAAKECFKLRDSKLTAVIPQGSYVGCYPNKFHKVECRRMLGLSDNIFVFVLLGRIEPYKGVLDLIQNFNKMPAKAHLVIAGRVSSREKLKLLQSAIDSADNIHLHEGYVPDDRIQVFLNASDVYVYPVREILNSGSISLAMSFGLPCVAPKLPTLMEALGEDGGILYEPENPGGLLAAMHQAMAQKDELGRIGTANLARAGEWTWDKAAQRTRELYYQLIAEK